MSNVWGVGFRGPRSESGKTVEGVGEDEGGGGYRVSPVRRKSGRGWLALTPTLSHWERGKKRRRYAWRPWVPDRSRGRRKRGGYPIESGKSSRGCAAGGVGVVYVGRIHPRPTPNGRPQETPLQVVGGRSCWTVLRPTVGTAPHRGAGRRWRFGKSVGGRTWLVGPHPRI